MGNNNSTTSNSNGGQAQSGGGHVATSEGVQINKYKVQLINLDGRMHVDFRNRNLKRLKTKIFNNLHQGLEVIQPDALNNSDYMKSRNTNNSVVFLCANTPLDTSKPVTPSSSSPSSPSSSPTITSTSICRDDTDNTDVNEDCCDELEIDSPVPSPKQSSPIQVQLDESLTNATQNSTTTTTTTATVEESTSTSTTTANASSPLIIAKKKKGKKQLTLPMIDGKLVVIHTLDLSMNRLEYIQNEIKDVFVELMIEEINFASNFFTYVPDLSSIRSIITLNFARNKLAKFPTDILSDLPNLSTLILDKNSISTIPEDIDRLKSLKYLSMRSNSIDSIPNNFCNIITLTTIDLSHNKIKSIPLNFDKLVNLKSIWLSSNSIQSLPSMKSFVKLNNIDLASNKLASISRDFALLAPRAKELLTRGFESDGASGGSFSEFEDADSTPSGCLRELNIRDNRDIITLHSYYRLVEETLNVVSSLPSEIIPRVFLGGLDSANNSAMLQTLGITHIVLAIGDSQPYFPKNFKYYTIDDARDTPNYDLSVHFEQTSAFIEQGRKVGGVLVHCRAGISRSSTLILAYLMRYQLLDYNQALRKVQAKRPQIQPNLGFKEQLLKYENKVSVLANMDKIVASF